MDENDRKRRGPLLWLADRPRGFWIATAVMLPVVYVASFGPACWISEPGVTPSTPGPGLTPDIDPRISTAPRCYWPIGLIAKAGPAPVRDCIVWYATRRCNSVNLPTSLEGDYSLQSAR
jgi:hypothetical protein